MRFGFDEDFQLQQNTDILLRDTTTQENLPQFLLKNIQIFSPAV